MGRNPCCPKEGMNRGAWTALEDKTLVDYIEAHGEGKWSNIPKVAGLKRCGKSCRLRWLNYLRPGIKRGNISEDEEDLIIRLHRLLGNRWSLIAGRLPGRTDNEIKNYWNSNLAKKEPGKKRKRIKCLSQLIKEKDNKDKNATLKISSVKMSTASPEPALLLPPPRVPEVTLVIGDTFDTRKGSIAEYESSDVSSQSLSPEIDLSGILESDFSMFGDIDDAKGREGSMVEDWSGLGCVDDIEFLMSSEFGSMATQMNGLFNSL